MFSRYNDPFFNIFPRLSFHTRAMGFEDPFEEMERFISRDPAFYWPMLSSPGPTAAPTPMQIDSSQPSSQQQNQLSKAAEDKQLQPQSQSQSQPNDQQVAAPAPSLASGMQWLQNYVRSPNVDVIERDSEYQVNVDVPGVQKEDLKVQLSEDRRGRKLLTVSGERKEEHHDQQGGGKDSTRRSSHRLYGKFSRSLVLPDNCSTKEVGGRSVSAQHADGVLKIILPKVPPEQNKAHVADIKIN